MNGSNTRYSSSSLLKNAHTWRTSPSWEPASEMGAVAFFMAYPPMAREKRLNVPARIECQIPRAMSIMNSRRNAPRWQAVQQENRRRVSPAGLSVEDGESIDLDRALGRSGTS